MSEKMLLSVNEACDALGLSRSVVYELLRKEELASLCIGRRTLIPRDALISFIDRQRSEADTGQEGT